MEKKLDMCEKTVIHKEIVETVKKQLPNDKKMESLALFYKMFSDPTKVKILWALDINEMCVCDLAVITNVTKSAIKRSKFSKIKKRWKDNLLFFS